MRIRISVERGPKDEPRPADGLLFAGLKQNAGPGLPGWLPSLCLHASLLTLATQMHYTTPVLATMQPGGAMPLIVRLEGKRYHVTDLGPNERIVLSRSGANAGKAPLQPAQGKDTFPQAAATTPATVEPVQELVLRDDLPPQMPLPQDAVVPNVIAWTAAPPAFTPSAPITPGKEQVVRSLPQPKLTDPVGTNEEPSLGSHTAPVRTIAASQEPLPPAPAAVIPPANSEALPSSLSGNSGLGESGAGSGAGANVRNASVIVPPRPGGTLPITTIRRPADGKFDVVVHGARAEIVAGSGSVLSGKPVYTVYLPMGTRKDWILQYCVPATAPADSSGTVVRIEPEVAIQGPWPILMLRTPVTLPPGERYMLVHGVVTAAGKLDKLRIVRPQSAPHGDAIVDVLTSWEFRPAMRAAAPLSVEVLIAIPADNV